MAAPLRKPCLQRFLQLNNSLGRNSSAKAFPLQYPNRCISAKQEDFFGIEQRERELGPKTEGPVSTESSASTKSESETVSHQLSPSQIENLITPASQKGSRAKELRYNTFFGEIRLDNYDRIRNLRNINPETFLRAIQPSKMRTQTDSFAESRFDDTAVKKVERKIITTRLSPAKKALSASKSDAVQSCKQAISHYHLDVNKTDEQTFEMEATKTPFPEACGNLSDDYHRQEAVSTDRFETKPEKVTLNRSSSSNTDVKIHPLGCENSQNDTFIDQIYFPSLLDADQQQTSLGSREPVGISGSSYIDQQFFPTVTSNEYNTTDSCDKEKCQKYSSGSSSPDNAKFTRSDEIKQKYCTHHPPSAPEPRHTKVSSEQVGILSKTEEKGLRGNEHKSKEFNFIDAQYATSDASLYHSSGFDAVLQEYNFTNENIQKSLEENYSRQTKDVFEQQPMHRKTAELESRRLKKKFTTAFTTSTSRQKTTTEESAQEKPDTIDKSKQSYQASETAYDVAMSMRRDIKYKLTDEKKHSERRMRLIEIKEQTPDIGHLPAADITKMLAESIIFENDDFLAINKPYGLPSHGGPEVRVSVGQLLEPLSQALDCGRGKLHGLHLVHRLDKETTGVMLLAKTPEASWQLLGMFRRREVTKVYWTITKGLPQPLEGVIDVPLTRQGIKGVFKTVVKPEKEVVGQKVKSQTWNRDKSSKALTQYKVLAYTDSMALVECKPETGFQHQVRAHLAQVMNAPVLGDHKYSHFHCLAPQRLFPEALQKLNLRQPEVRYLPMHLHAKSLVLPEWRGQRNVFITAKVPQYFIKNLKALKIKIPSK